MSESSYHCATSDLGGTTTCNDQHVPTILLVDDDPEISQTIEMRLSNYHVNVLRRFTGIQGIGEANYEKPDLIITDLRMPNGEGDEVLTCIKRNSVTAHIPVIVLSGQPGDDLPQRMLKMGAAAFLRKPVHYVDLIAEISKHIELREMDWASYGDDGFQCG